MAQFYAGVQGSSGMVTCQGSKRSGMNAHIHGWSVGIEVECQFDGEHDIISVFQTGGSNGEEPRKLIGFVTDAPDSEADLLEA